MEVGIAKDHGTLQRREAVNSDKEDLMVRLFSGTQHP